MTSTPATMRAHLISHPGPPSVLRLTNVPTPVPLKGEALIQIRAFGINHAEMHMRRGEWAESVPISGIECVGVVASCPGGEFLEGTPVAAMMGGLGRTRGGTYAEYTTVGVGNVVPLGGDSVQGKGGEGVGGLSWAELAALPESYCTASTCLFRNLEVQKGQRLLIRGGSSAFGRAAVNLAVQAGAEVTVTTRDERKFGELKKMGVKEAVLEGKGLPDRWMGEKFDCVLELVGNSTIVESLKLVKRGGRVCLAGWLGGLDPIKEFNPLLEMASGVHWSFFGSFVFGTEEFPLSDVPLTEIVRAVAEGKFDAKPWKVFNFEGIPLAHQDMEDGTAKGKMVVVVD